MRSMFQPIKIGKVEIKNRFVHSATHEAMAADDGTITGEILKRYARLAKGDIGLIIPGHLYVHPFGQAHQGQIGIHCDDMISMSRPFIREPSLVRKFSEGKSTEASCISCNKCFAAMFNEIPVRCYQKGLPQNL